MKARIQLAGLVLLAIAVGALAAVGMNELDGLKQRSVVSAADRADLRREVAASKETNAAQQTLIDELTRRCEDAKGCTPPPIPPAIRGAQGDIGIQGPVGPRGPRGASCVEELGLRTCRGPDGDTGTTGTPGSDGVPGVAGKNGADGKDGAPGPQGEPGPAGPAGADGRGIASLSCTDAGVWQVTYTDGATADAGSCRTNPGGQLR